MQNIHQFSIVRITFMFLGVNDIISKLQWSFMRLYVVSTGQFLTESISWPSISRGQLQRTPLSNYPWLRQSCSRMNTLIGKNTSNASYLVGTQLKIILKNLHIRFTLKLRAFENVKFTIFEHQAKITLAWKIFRENDWFMNDDLLLTKWFHSRNLIVKVKLNFHTVICTVWKNENFSLTKKIFRETNSLVT